MIQQITVKHFRGVAGEVSLSLQSLTLFSGRNGLGKTTLFDAIDWCLFGSASRLGADEDTIDNLYQRQGPAEVILNLAVRGEDVVVHRTRGAGVNANGRALTDRGLIELLVEDTDIFPPHTRDLGTRARRLCYLPQTELDQLLSAENKEDRTALLAALAGIPNAGVVTTSLRKVGHRVSERVRALTVHSESLSTDIAAL